MWTMIENVMGVVWCSSRINRSLGFGVRFSKFQKQTTPIHIPQAQRKRSKKGTIQPKLQNTLVPSPPKTHMCNNKGIIIIVHVLPRFLLAKHFKPPIPNSKIPQIKWRRKNPRTHPTHVSNVTWDDHHKTKGIIIIIIGHVNPRNPRSTPNPQRWEIQPSTCDKN